MKLIDLTRPLDPEDIKKFPENRRAGVATMVPEIEYQRPGHEGADAVCANFGCTRDDLPDGEGWGAERLLRKSAPAQLILLEFHARPATAARHLA